MNTYLIEVAEATPGDKNIAHAYGDLDAMAYHARRLKEALTEGHTYSLTLSETAGVLGDNTRTLTETTGDAEIVSYVLNKRIRAERSRTAPAAE